ncbi:MAG: zinc ribbon domain-containing protein [Desulfobacterales bacterium]|nr:zinc ribbon domain-containing protein [Desulfobacterales bacterium]
MPIYEYECTKCGRIQETWQKFSDKPLETCDYCSGRLHKLISQCTFHLKGTGWYATDYANKSGASSSGSSSPKKKDKKTDTKAKSSTPSSDGL